MLLIANIARERNRPLTQQVIVSYYYPMINRKVSYLLILNYDRSKGKVLKGSTDVTRFHLACFLVGPSWRQVQDSFRAFFFKLKASKLRTCVSDSQKSDIRLDLLSGHGHDGGHHEGFTLTLT